MAGSNAILDPPTETLDEVCDETLDLAPGGPPDEPIDPTGDSGDGDSGDDEPIDWCILAVFWSITEAHLARLKLEDEDIPVVLLDELTCSTGCLAIAAGGVKLQVPRPLLLDAAIVLRRRAGGEIEVATFTSEQRAKMAACVAEAAGAQCRVVAFDGLHAVQTSADDATVAARALRGTRFAAAVEPWIVATPDRCNCADVASSDDLPAHAYRRWLALRFWQWLDRHIPGPLRPRRCLACGGPRPRRRIALA